MKWSCTESDEEDEIYEPRSLEEAVHTLQQRIIKRFNIEQRLILDTNFKGRVISFVGN
jgi:hypothetical protein